MDRRTTRVFETPEDMDSGTKFTTNMGDLVVVRYHSSKKVDVKFVNTGYTCNTTATSIRQGLVKDPIFPSKFGVGFLGIGPHKMVPNGVTNPAYAKWANMMERCYDEKYLERKPTYRGCSVCDEWHNFQNFADWYETHAIDGYQLDKDIKVKGNKIYNPLNCLFVPQPLNLLFTDCAAKRGELARGVRRSKSRFRASIRDHNGFRISIGSFPTEEQASNAYEKARHDKIVSIIESGVYGELGKFLYQHI